MASPSIGKRQTVVVENLGFKAARGPLDPIMSKAEFAPCIRGRLEAEAAL